MKTNVLLLILIAISATAACSTSAENVAAKAVPTAERAAPSVEIADALTALERTPDSAANHTRLAVAYIKHARLSGDFTLNNDAERAVGNALIIDPSDRQARKLRASLHLTFHRFAEALALGMQLENEDPTDPFVLAVITDALTELGKYPEAVTAAQRMIDRKPSSSAYARVAHLRWLHGDHKGAVELYKIAARTADPLDKEAQSWALSQLGDEYWRNGKFADAEKVYDEALSFLPEYPRALAGKGRARASLGDLAAGAVYLSRANATAPNTDTIILLGDVYSKLGNTLEAARQYSLAEVENDFFDAHRVALRWADSGVNLEKALQIAQEDYDTQKDIYAADILAWCLFKNGKLTDARSMIAEAMRLKTRDAKIFYHAGMIEAASGNRGRARKLLQTALRLNPKFDLIQAEAAKTALLKLG
jgi:tetratricopeptide (TPR) repeat protein